MRLFSKKAHIACKHCRYGRKTMGGEKVLCTRKGIVELDFSCRKYQYDPLKRVPRRRPSLPAFTQEDFKL